MSIVRIIKTALVAAIALFFTLVAFSNVTDYGTNWAFVQHVLAMDTIFPDSTLRWRAITGPALQTLAYWLIIAFEAATAVVLWAGVVRLIPRLRGDFAAAKSTAIAGLGMGFLLYAGGFIAIGGEWFAMWQSHEWNGQQAAFGFLTMIGIVLIVLLLPEPDAE
jgi:predicted small integral membrane protein